MGSGRRSIIGSTRCVGVLFITMFALRLEAQATYFGQSGSGMVFPGATGQVSLTAAVGDVDSSGAPDLAVACMCAPSWSVLVYRDPFVVGFGPPVAAVPILPAPGGVVRVAIGDVTGDGAADLVIAEGAAPYAVSVYAGDGSGTTFIQGPYLPWTASAGVTLFDFDGDGTQDILCHQVGLAGGVLVTGAVVAFGGRSPPWSVGATVPLPNGTLNFRCGQLDADGFGDIAFLDPQSPGGGGTVVGLGRCSGTGGSTFSPPAAYRVLDPSGTSPLPLPLARTLYAVEDMDGDGLSDLLVGELDPSAPMPVARVLFSDPRPTVLIASANVGPLNWIPTTPLVADWDVDGIKDILWFIPGTAFNSPNYVLVRGLGARNFDRTDFTWVAPASLSPQAPITADFDGDSDTDIISLAPLPWVFIENFAIDGRGVAGTGGLGPRIVIDPPTVGNAAFGIGLADALPTAPGVLVVSLARTSGANPNAPWVSLAPADVLIPFGSFGTAVTSAQGTARIPLPLPAWPALVGTTLYAQWAVLDPNGGFLSSSGALSLSPLRQIILR